MNTLATWSRVVPAVDAVVSSVTWNAIAENRVGLMQAVMGCVSLAATMHEGPSIASIQECRQTFPRIC